MKHFKDRRIISLLAVLAVSGGLCCQTFGEDDARLAEEGLRITLEHIGNLAEKHPFMTGRYQQVELSPDAETPFTRGLDIENDQVRYARLPLPMQSNQIALVLADGWLDSVYVDLNGDGEFQENERLLPGSNASIVDLPPITLNDESDIPRTTSCRIYALGDRVFYMSLGGWQGTGVWNDEPFMLLIGDTVLSGRPDAFGENLFVMMEAEQSRQVSRPAALDKTIHYGREYFAIGIKNEGGAWGAVLRPLDNIGTLRFKAPSGKPMKGTVQYAALRSADESGRSFPFNNLPLPDISLPSGRYRVDALLLQIVDENEDVWYVRGNLNQLPVS